MLYSLIDAYIWIQIYMNVFVLPSVTLSSALLAIVLILTSCTNQFANQRRPVNTPPKVFQFSYQEPSRQLEYPGLAQKLSKGKLGDRLTIKLADGQSSAIRLGEKYYSANGHQCRRYTIKSSRAKSACKINNRWYQAQPILINE